MKNRLEVRVDFVLNFKIVGERFPHPPKCLSPLNYAEKFYVCTYVRLSVEIDSHTDQFKFVST